MLKTAANLSMLFQEVEFQERFAAAKAAGFRGVEFMFQPERDNTSIRRLLADNGLVQVLANMPGSPADKGLAAAPGRESEFRDRFERGLEAAVVAKAPLMHVTAGVVDGTEYPAACESFWNNLSWAGPRAAMENVALVIEAINQTDVPNYFVRSLADAVSWCERLAGANVHLILDLYHAAKEGLKLREAVELALPRAKHIQLARAPDRDEPVPTEDLGDAFTLLRRGGYSGWIGCEYKPKAATIAGLGWREQLSVS